MSAILERLLKSSATIWEQYYTHPFVSGITDGSLSIEKFKYYLIQDYLYLFDYAKVFAMGIVKARDPQTMRAFAQYVHSILDGEMDIHKGYMTRLGITQEQAESAQPALTNVSYTAYMRVIAQEEGAAEIVTAILSCAISYEHIAKHMLQVNPKAAEHPFYGEWVASYASEDYAADNRALCALLDRLTVHYNEDQIVRLTQIFVACSEYERMFWDMAWNMEQ